MQTLNNEVQKLTPSCHNSIKTYLRSAFSGGNSGKYIFRRCGSDVTMSSPVYRKVTPFSNQVLSGNRTTNMDEMKQYGQIDCTEFYGTTTRHFIRDEFVCTMNKPIRFSSHTYFQPNIGMNPQEPCRLNEVITPLEGDLLCIWFSNETINNRRENDTRPLIADAWFIASDQFLRAHTLIVYDRHNSFDKMIPKATPTEERETILRKKMFCGNNLMTNTYLKHKLALEQSGLPPMNEKEATDMYWHLRTEPASRNWVDVYAALVLMARYGEMPGEINMPNTAGDGPKRKQWSLPDYLLESYVLKIVEPITESKEEIADEEDEEEEIEVQITIELPRREGTRFYTVALEADWTKDYDDY